jgi:DNA-binding transcriptional regulator YhcF (GntR family)
MKWKFQGDRPIYAQLIEQLERGVLTGVYPPGSPVPSVRTLALEAGVNPNTMQKALAELETQGLLHTHRTAGRTVTEDIAMIEGLKVSLADTQIEAFFDGMQSIGIERSEAAKLITKAANEGSSHKADVSKKMISLAKSEASQSEPDHNSGGDRVERSETRQEGAEPTMENAANVSEDNKEVM